jgi:hypothetical protein
MDKILKEIAKSQKSDDVSAMVMNAEERKMYQQMMEWRSIIRCKEPMTRLPFIFEFD